MPPRSPETPETPEARREGRRRRRALAREIRRARARERAYLRFEAEQTARRWRVGGSGDFRWL
ncbi:hypothetical protein [Nesterenkonia sp. HG001]|uniref:hypothetical protein n=1 Tax=Nesterenkonia sp. HG001 TaxID=2983207 RepID=UPI002AC49B0B|nr:hypothetical protein [Nesterenkonia sp. HG001]MDZ5077252.1 hypothetical protein [Nesterenkonia sp. HG001]